MSRKVLVTGANGEFGQLITKTLLAAGHIVIASMRDIQARNNQQKKQLEALGAYVVDIDVTDEASVNKGVNQAFEYAQGLDVVINNAGLGCYGIQETFTDHDWQKIFDVNVFGVQRVNRAALPYFKANKEGLILHVSSLIGRMTLPYWGPYSASKWALEALAETYRIELSQFNIDSCIVEPGPYATSFFENLLAPSDNTRVVDASDQKQEAKEIYSNFSEFLSSCSEQNTKNVTHAILQLISMQTGKRPLRTIVDNSGIGEHIEGYNKHHEQLTSDVFHQFGIENMLSPQADK